MPSGELPPPQGPALQEADFAQAEPASFSIHCRGMKAIKQGQTRRGARKTKPYAPSSALEARDGGATRYPRLRRARIRS